MDSVAFIALFVVSIFDIVTGKDASTQTTEKPTMIEELKNMDVTDYIRAGALSVGLIAPLLHGRRTWLMALVVLTAAGCLGDFFFPKQILEHITKTDIDEVHQYLLQILAVTGLGRVASIYQQWESRDPGVSTSILLSHAIGGTIASVTLVFDYNKWQARFAPQFLTLALLPMVLIALGCVVYTFRGSSFGKGNLDFRGRLSRHILIDVMFLFVAGFFYFGYPDLPLVNVVLKGFRPDGVHYHLVRIMGLAAFGVGFQGFMSLGFQNENDQKAYLFGRVVMIGLSYPLVALYQWKYHFIDMGSNIGLFVITGAITGNVLCGYFNLQWPKAKRN